MKIKTFCILVFFSVFLTFCSNDDSKNLPEAPRQNTCDNDSIYLKRTFCCLEGPTVAIPNEIISISYSSNIENAEYNWRVLGGSIVLVEGENSATAKFKVGNNFVRDSILGESHSIDGMTSCSDIIIISSENN